MSNPEAQPHETVCSPGAAHAPIEILDPRDVPLGGLRAMNVRRTLPQRSRSLIGAWCFVDHYGPDDVAATGGMNVPAHPHIGLQTASWLFSGEIEHRDSAGFHALVRPGELNLMTAGRGISHSERSTPGTAVLHGAQLWIALPGDARSCAKDFEHYAPPVLTGAGWHAQVFLGSLLGETSPVGTFTPLLGAELRLDPDASIEFAIDPAFEHGILVDSGAVVVARTAGDTASEPALVARDRLAYLPIGASTVRLTAGGTGGRLLLLGGAPFGEQVVMWWNFVGRDHEEILQARADWQAELAANGVADVSAEPRAVSLDPAPLARDPGRFGLPGDEPEPPLPAPAAPLARLVPRRR